MTKILNLNSQKNSNRVLVLKNQSKVIDLSISQYPHGNNSKAISFISPTFAQYSYRKVVGWAVIFSLFAGFFWFVSMGNKSPQRYQETPQGFEFRKLEDTLGFKLMIGTVTYDTGVWGVYKGAYGSCFLSTVLIDKGNPNVAVIARLEPLANRGGDMLYLAPMKISKVVTSPNLFQDAGLIDIPHFSIQNKDGKFNYAKVMIGVDDIDELDAVYNEDQDSPFQGIVDVGGSVVKMGLPYADFNTTKKQSYSVSFLTAEGFVNIPISYPSSIINNIISNKCY